MATCSARSRLWGGFLGLSGAILALEKLQFPFGFPNILRRLRVFDDLNPILLHIPRSEAHLQRSEAVLGRYLGDPTGSAFLTEM